ncbi:MAG: hypothetical protein KJ066_18990 [Acidobacteria bacterium]|nr:hypothetical protein [Acidobacteriota bacterium]
MRWSRVFTPVVAIALPLVACSSDSSSRSPTAPSARQPAQAPQATPLEQSGPVAIEFLDATPAPGAAIAGCGSSMAGCVNRVVMRFSLRAQEPGPVLNVHAFLHATNLQACLLTSTGPFPLARGEARELALVFDRADACPVPLTIATLAVVVEGPVQVASRRTWRVTYTFVP